MLPLKTIALFMVSSGTNEIKGLRVFMYKFIFVLLLCCTNSFANNSQKYCDHWGDIARAAMTSRQAGVPLKVMLMLVSDETAVGILRAAYDQVQLESVAQQQISIDRFVETVVSECLK